MGLCKLPPSIGYAVGRLLADLFSAQKNSSLVQAVRANQWVVRGKQLSSDQLDEAVRDVFRHAARCYYDFYSNLRNPDAIRSMVSLSPQVEALIESSRNGNQGAMVVGPHLSNFDLAMLAMAYQGFRAQGISPEQPPGGYVIQNQIRASTGLKITPVSPKSLQQAIDRMRKGGIAFTGVDRPVLSEKINPGFFGQTSNLPTGAIRMAVKADVPVIVVSARMNAEGKYQAKASEPIPMQKYTGRTTTIRKNTETVLEVVAKDIREAPEQWLMFYPVWATDRKEIP